MFNLAVPESRHFRLPDMIGVWPAHNFADHSVPMTSSSIRKTYGNRPSPSGSSPIRKTSSFRPHGKLDYDSRPFPRRAINGNKSTQQSSPFTNPAKTKATVASLFRLEANPRVLYFGS